MYFVIQFDFNIIFLRLSPILHLFFIFQVVPINSERESTLLNKAKKQNKIRGILYLFLKT